MRTDVVIDAAERVARANVTQLSLIREYAFMADIDRDENVSVARTTFDVGRVITAIAVLLLVLGLLKWLGVSPI